MTDFPPKLPHAEIEEVLPDVFFVMGQTRPNFGDQTWQFSRSMTVVRDGGELTLVNTLRLDDAGILPPGQRRTRLAQVGESRGERLRSHRAALV